MVKRLLIWVYRLELLNGLMSDQEFNGGLTEHTVAGRRTSTTGTFPADHISFFVFSLTYALTQQHSRSISHLKYIVGQYVFLFTL